MHTAFEGVTMSRQHRLLRPSVLQLVRCEVLSLGVEEKRHQTLAVILCQAHALLASTSFLDGVSAFTCSASLLGLPLRKVGGPLPRRELVVELALRSHQVVVASRRAGRPIFLDVRREVETTEVSHGIGHVTSEWLAVHPSNEVGADTAVERRADFEQIRVGG